MLEYYNNITKTLIISFDFNDELKDIPDDTKIIQFNNDLINAQYSKFNQEIKENVLPINLHTLSFGYSFNQEIKENVLPINLHTLTFGDYFNQEINVNVLPINLHTIEFSDCFNQEIKENVLPINLHTLTFGNDFNQEIKENVLPINLHTLRLGYHFNQEIKENVLPINLHTLTFGWDFNQEIKENVLPKSIKKIFLFSFCNLINNLPLHIKEVYIKFCTNRIFNKEITNLPLTLEKIIITDKKYLKYITKKPFNCDIVIQKID
jgi:hypothetical protein